MNHKERLTKTIRGEMVDILPYGPRLDLWYNANKRAGTLPEKYKHHTIDEIYKAEGWPQHKTVPAYLAADKPEDIYHRAIGLYHLKEFVIGFEFHSDVEIEVNQESGDDEEMTHVVYRTPVGVVEVRHGQTEAMKASGASITWVKENAIKGPQDYKVLAHIFGNMKLSPRYEQYTAWKETVGEEGIAVANTMGLACTSPIHFIQKTFLEATEFYLHYKDYPQEMSALAEALEHFYNQALPIIAESPADCVLWSANVDDMITYPELYEEHFLPWCQKAAQALHDKGKLIAMHPDGENQKLMDLIAASDMDLADAVAPWPMTKVKLADYYNRWCRDGQITIWGGVPESMFLHKSASDEEFESFMDEMFASISPGTRFIVGIGDTAPPGADFDRLVRLSERCAKEGRLPIEAGGYDPISAEQIKTAEKRIGTQAGQDTSIIQDQDFLAMQKLVLKGDEQATVTKAQAMLDEGKAAADILNIGMLSAMAIIGERFTDGTEFIPEVLLSARALNQALVVLEPHLAKGESQSKGKILMGTVFGDLHDIGKNMVITMLKGVGFEVIDLGINVKVDHFVEQVVTNKPVILALSALLTTTMPQMQTTIEGLVEDGVRDKVNVIVGGAPVNQNYADEIKADGYAEDAGAAVKLVKSFLKL